MPKDGITRDGWEREIRDNLNNSQLITLSREEARDLIDVMPEDGEEGDALAVALDYAQGNSAHARYVVIYVEEGD